MLGRGVEGVKMEVGEVEKLFRCVMLKGQGWRVNRCGERGGHEPSSLTEMPSIYVTSRQ